MLIFLNFAAIKYIFHIIIFLSPTALCEDLPSPMSGEVRLSGNQVGDTATYTCEDGSTLVGSSTQVCTQISAAEADWSGVAPFCESKSSSHKFDLHVYHLSTIHTYIAGITVRFAMPSYTFTENGTRGTIVVVKSGVSSAPISVRVVGGKYTHPHNS